MSCVPYHASIIFILKRLQWTFPKIAKLILLGGTFFPWGMILKNWKETSAKFPIFAFFDHCSKPSGYPTRDHNSHIPRKSEIQKSNIFRDILASSSKFPFSHLQCCKVSIFIWKFYSVIQWHIYVKWVAQCYMIIAQLY